MKRNETLATLYAHQINGSTAAIQRRTRVRKPRTACRESRRFRRYAVIILGSQSFFSSLAYQRLADATSGTRTCLLVAVVSTAGARNSPPRFACRAPAPDRPLH